MKDLKKEYAMIILKPDSIRDNLEFNMIQDLKEAGIKVLWGKYWEIPPCVVSLIYPKEVGKNTYSSTKRALTFGPSLVLLVRGINIYDRLTIIKGKMDKGGIRGKYCEKRKKELIDMGYAGQKLQDRLAENRLHTADNFEETIIIYSLCVSFPDKEQIKKNAPDFYELCNKLR